MGRGLVPTIIGLAIGLGAAVGLTRFLSFLLYGLDALDPMTLVGVSVFMATTALLACYIPARRAVQLDPLVALRHE